MSPLGWLRRAWTCELTFVLRDTILTTLIGSQGRSSRPHSLGHGGQALICQVRTFKRASVATTSAPISRGLIGPLDTLHLQPGRQQILALILIPLVFLPHILHRTSIIFCNTFHQCGSLTIRTTSYLAFVSCSPLAARIKQPIRI